MGRSESESELRFLPGAAIRPNHPLQPGEGGWHWPACYPALLAGGCVFGSSDRTGAYPATEPLRPEDLSATMFHLLGIDPKTEVRHALNRPLPISAGSPIDGILARVPSDGLGGCRMTAERIATSPEASDGTVPSLRSGLVAMHPASSISRPVDRLKTGAAASLARLGGYNSSHQGSRTLGGPRHVQHLGARELGRYRILSKLGQGGMGAVYLAEDTTLSRRVAVKVPHFNESDGPKVIERFQREARVAAAIDHPNLCPVHDCGEVNGIHFLVMPYIEGTPLSHLIDEDDLWPLAEQRRWCGNWRWRSRCCTSAA